MSELLSLVLTGILSGFYRCFLIWNLSEYIQEFNLKFKIPKKLKSHIKKIWYWILKFKGYWNVVQNVCKIWANFGNFYVKNVLKTLRKEKINTLQVKNPEQLNSWIWTRNSYLNNACWNLFKLIIIFLTLLFLFLKLAYSFGLTHWCQVFPIYTLGIF